MKGHVGFIGLGQMGKWMAGHLIGHAFDLFVFDRDPRAMDLLVQQGALSTQSPAGLAAASGFVFLSLPDEKAADQVIFGRDGIIEGAHPGTMVVDCGTSDYQWTRECAASLRERGIEMLDAPVTGLEKKAREAALTIMVGGNADLCAQALPLLKRMGKVVVHMGAIGSGQLAKMINNVIYNINIAALAEMLPMAVKLGLDPDKIAGVINSGSGASFASEFFIAKMLAGRFTGTYSLEKAFKDMRHLEAAAERLDVRLPLYDAALNTYTRALKAGWGCEDKGAMIKVYEKALGVLFRQGTAGRSGNE